MTLARNNRKRVTSQFPDWLRMVVHAFGAGLTFEQALPLIIETSAPPMRESMKGVMHDIASGIDHRHALKKWAAEIGSKEIIQCIDAYSLLIETGGDISAFLSNYEETLYERERIRKKVRLNTFQGYIQALVMAIMPFVVAGILITIVPEFGRPLITHQLGLTALSVSLLLIVTGLFWVYTIIHIKV
jgi:tight adherence protein B